MDTIDGFSIFVNILQSTVSALLGAAIYAAFPKAKRIFRRRTPVKVGLPSHHLVDNTTWVRINSWEDLRNIASR